MVWAQEIKNLAADIRISHRDRTARLSEIKDETKEIRKQGHQILRDADAFMKNVRTELTQAAKGIRDFLAKSEGARKEDSNALMQEIRAQMKDIRIRVRDIKGETKDFLAKSGEKRMADFKTMMKDIKGDIEAIRRSVADTLKTAKDSISSYTSERKEATRYWASLVGGVAGGEVATAPKKRGRKKKQPSFTSQEET